ncbi:hypothetical protein E4U10_007001 [Claviceps purpurea]|nr:hypothetical protein E4U10_007001 [Claviceps purpurea]
MWTVAEAGESTGSIAKEAQQRWFVGLAWHELRRPSHRGGISSATEIAPSVVLHSENKDTRWGSVYSS